MVDSVVPNLRGGIPPGPLLAVNKGISGTGCECDGSRALSGNPGLYSNALGVA